MAVDYTDIIADNINRSNLFNYKPESTAKPNSIEAVSEFEKISAERKQAVKDGVAPDFMITQGYMMFSRKCRENGETIREAYTRISSLGRHYKPDPELAKRKFFELLWKGELAASSPVLTNTGKNNKGHSVSCSGNDVQDSILGMYSGIKENALLSKFGYGTSSYLGNIRHRGAKVSTGGTANGPVPTFRGMVAMSEDVSQGSMRRGAWAGYLPVMHPDFYELWDFVFHNPSAANVGWCFKQRDIDALNHNDPEIVNRWNMILYLRSRFGKGYIVKPDTANWLAPQAIKNSGIPIVASNLCVTGDTLIHTDNGMISVKELYEDQTKFSAVIDSRTEANCSTVDYKTDTFSTEGMESAERATHLKLKGTQLRSTNGMHLTKRNAKVYKVTTSKGYELTSTDQHKYYVLNDLGNIHKIALSDINIESDKLLLQSAEGMWGNLGNYDEGYGLGISKELPKWLFKASKDTVRGFLSGLIDSTLCNTDASNLTFRYTTEEVLKDLQKLLINAGIVSTRTDSVLSIDLASNVALLDFVNSEKLYNTIQTFSDLYALPVDDIRSIDYVGQEDVYDTTQEYSHSLIFNGIVTGNCTEIFLPQNSEYTFSCVLSSLNLAKWDTFAEDTIFWATIFLDCVVSETLEQMENSSLAERAEFEKIYNFTRDFRALGLGTLGWHTYLQEKFIPIDSLEAKLINKRIFSKLQSETLKASKHLYDINPNPAKYCKGTGLNNATRLAIAPNTSSALYCGGNSQGIEPLVANSFNQNTAAGEVTRLNPTLIKHLKSIGKYDEQLIEDIGLKYQGSIQHLDFLSPKAKKVFSTAFETSQEALVDLAASRQPYICQGQSLNLFFTSSTSEQKIASVTKLALNNPYIKSLYYQRGMRSVRGSTGECLQCEA